MKNKNIYIFCSTTITVFYTRFGGKIAFYLKSRLNVILDFSIKTFELLPIKIYVLLLRVLYRLMRLLNISLYKIAL